MDKKSLFSKLKNLRKEALNNNTNATPSPDESGVVSPPSERSRTKSIFGRRKDTEGNNRLSVIPNKEDLPEFFEQFTNGFRRGSDADVTPRFSDADKPVREFRASVSSRDEEPQKIVTKREPINLYSEEDATKIIAWNMRSKYLNKRLKDYTKTNPDLRDGRLRTQTIREIQSTETRYVRDLEVCVRCFLEPLRNHPKKILKNEDIDSIFGTIEQVLQTNDLLLNEINKTMNDWPQVRIGDVFKKFAPVLKAYTSYINQFDKSAKLLEEWEKKSKPLNQFLEKTYLLPETGQQRLASFLVMPVQRIPRYRMLLQELQKRTPPNHVDYAAIDVALNEVNKVAQYVNESKRKEENNVIVFHVQDLLGSRFQILPHRHYIRRGCMTVKCDKISHLKPGTTQFDVFLFNDMILILPKGVVPQFNSVGDSLETQKSTLTQKEIINQCIIIYLCFASLKEREPVLEQAGSGNSLQAEAQTAEYNLQLTGFFHTNSYKFEFSLASELELAEWEADINVNISRIHKIFLRRGIDPTTEHLEKTRLKLHKAVFVREGQRDQLLSKREQQENLCKQLEDEMQECEEKYTQLMNQINEIKKKHEDARKKLDGTGDNTLEIAASLEDDKNKLGETDQVIWAILNHDMQAFQELFDDKPNVPPEQLDGPVKKEEKEKNVKEEKKKDEDEDQSAMSLYFRFAQAKFTVSDILTPIDRDVPEEDVEIENEWFQIRAPTKWLDMEQELVPSKYRTDRISNNNKLTTHQTGWNVSPDEGDAMALAQKYLNEDLYSGSREEHFKKLREREAKKLKDEEEKKLFVEGIKRKVEQSRDRKGLTTSVEDVEEMHKTIQRLQKENEALKAQLEMVTGVKTAKDFEETKEVLWH